MELPKIENFDERFSDENLTSVVKSRIISIIIFTIGIILSIYIYVTTSILGFYQYFNFYYFYYDDWLSQISFCYLLSWSLFFLFLFSLANHSYLHKFTYKDKLYLKKFEDKKNAKSSRFNSRLDLLVIYNYIGQGLISFMILFELNYYARNVEVFNLIILCYEDLGYCIIPETVYLPYFLIRTIFTITNLGLYSFLILILTQEYISAHLKLKKKPLKSEEKLVKKKKYIPIEQRKKQKMAELREKYIQNQMDKKAKLQEEFEKRYKKESMGKKALKKEKSMRKKEGIKNLKEEEKEKIKQIKKVSRKDEFDFT